MAGIESGRLSGLMVAALREYGLPEAIRLDNGAPFASNAPDGVRKLSSRWERLGIRHERIAPGQPQQNGEHERFHLSLLRERFPPHPPPFEIACDFHIPTRRRLP